MLNGFRQTNSNDVKYPANCANRVALDTTHNGDNGPIDTKILDQLYEPKPDKKIVRIITVIVYCFSVSLGAILLSLYYLFLWDPYIKSHLNNKTTDRPLVSFSGTQEPPSEPKLLALQAPGPWPEPSWTTSSRASSVAAAQLLSPPPGLKEFDFSASSASSSATTLRSSLADTFAAYTSSSEEDDEDDEDDEEEEAYVEEEEGDGEESAELVVRRKKVKHKAKVKAKAGADKGAAGSALSSSSSSSSLSSSPSSSGRVLEDPFVTYAKAHHLQPQPPQLLHHHDRKKRGSSSGGGGDDGDSSGVSLQELLTGRFERFSGV